ncbi:MAG: hypothetical protein J6J04_02460 [Oscillospiraceae bacterium]|nr:hypothetical protein [Oscillospiraceae bacterium]
MKLTVRETAVFAMLGAIMYCSKMIMEIVPNVHLLGAFIVAFTVVYRKKALYPIYVFILITGLMNGFATWWMPYLYLWAVLWGMTMLLPKNIPDKWKPLIYMSVSAAHGYLYGTLYAPAQAILFGLDFQGMITWVIAGLPWDVIHGTSNFLCGVLIYPMVKLLQKIEKYSVA